MTSRGWMSERMNERVSKKKKEKQRIDKTYDSTAVKVFLFVCGIGLGSGVVYFAVCWMMKLKKKAILPVQIRDVNDYLFSRKVRIHRRWPLKQTHSPKFNELFALATRYSCCLVSWNDEKTRKKKEIKSHCIAKFSFFRDSQSLLTIGQVILILRLQICFVG